MAAIIPAIAAAAPALKTVGAIFSVVSAVGSIAQGQAQRRQYNLQAQMATVEGERKQIQYQQRANDLLRRRNATNAALAARAAAGGIDPFSGSPDIVRAANDTAAGREYSMLLADADAAMRGGMFQASLYRQAGSTAARAGFFNAAASLGTAASAMDGFKFGGELLPASQAAPIREAVRFTP